MSGQFCISAALRVPQISYCVGEFLPVEICSVPSSAVNVILRIEHILLINNCWVTV